MKQATEKDGWRCFLALCNELKSPEEINEFLNLFLTIEERNDIADRILLVKALLKGQQTQREIANELKISITKITRGSNTLKTIGKNLRSFLIKNI